MANKMNVGYVYHLLQDDRYLALSSLGRYPLAQGSQVPYARHNNHTKDRLDGK